jgi:hypothetical protein
LLRVRASMLLSSTDATVGTSSIPARDLNDEFVRLAVAEREAHAVHAVEGDGRGEGESFVPVDERMVSRERVK